MLIWVLFKMALRSLVTHKLRTFLTALGIIIGVASVISMILSVKEPDCKR